MPRQKKKSILKSTRRSPLKNIVRTLKNLTHPIISDWISDKMVGVQVRKKTQSKKGKEKMRIKKEKRGKKDFFFFFLIYPFGLSFKPYTKPFITIYLPSALPAF